MTFIIIYTDIALFSKVFLFYGLIAFGFGFVLIIFTVSSVNYEANKSYKLLNSLYVSYLLHENLSTKIKLKVKILFSLFQNLNFFKDINSNIKSGSEEDWLLVLEVIYCQLLSMLWSNQYFIKHLTHFITSENFCFLIYPNFRFYHYFRRYS